MVNSQAVGIIDDLRRIECRDDLPQIMHAHGCFDSAAEIGVCLGVNLAHYYSFHPHLLVGVDLWEGKYSLRRKLYFSEKTMDDIRINCPGVVLKRGISWEVASEFPDDTFDLVYIDACHRYESVTKDIEAWWPKVKPEGVFAGHDYTKRHPGVIKAVDEFISQNSLELIITIEGTGRRHGDKTWLVVKQ